MATQQNGKTIAVIGAGIAGLAAGCYGRMNGYQTTIFESHTLPGGLCTSWQRGGYKFDGCLHWLVGSRPGSAMNQFWRELGALEGMTIHDQEEFFRVEDGHGRSLIFYTDADRLEMHLRDLSPRDEPVIRDFCDNIRFFSRMEMPVDGVGGAEGILAGVLKLPRLLPYLPAFARYSRQPMEAFAEQFQDPFLRQAFRTWFGLPDFPLIATYMTLAWMHARDAGYPIGGSLAFSRNIERRYRDLGGEIRYGARVQRILVEGDRAVGVRLASGEEHRADYVISCADGNATIFEMLEGRYVDDEIRGYYEQLPTFPSLVQVSLGVNRDLSAEPHMVTFPLAEPLMVAGQRHERMAYKHYGYDATLAPSGRSVVTVTFDTALDHWRPLLGDRASYEAEKQRVAEQVITALDRRFPGLAGQIEAVDVATPHTFVRYTGNWKGSYEGFLITTKTVGKSLKKTLPGLDRFYMAGQWVEPGGGVPTAAMSARGAIKMICRRDARRFTTTERS